MIEKREKIPESKARFCSMEARKIEKDIHVFDPLNTQGQILLTRVIESEPLRLAMPALVKDLESRWEEDKDVPL